MGWNGVSRAIVHNAPVRMWQRSVPWGHFSEVPASFGYFSTVEVWYTWWFVSWGEWVLIILVTQMLLIQDIQPRGGANPHGIKWNQPMEISSMPDLCLIEPDLSLTEYNCQSESWSDWHLNLLTKSTKTHPDEPTRVVDRGRAKFPRLHAVVYF